jgi:hypothetical protein
MLELLGKIALSSSWTGRIDNGQIRINEINFLILVKDGSPVRHRKTGKNMFSIHTKIVKSRLILL